MGSNPAVGKNIARIRKERGLTQGALAKAVGGLSRSYLSDVENGKEIPSGTWVASVAMGLGVDAEVLAGKQSEVDQLDRIVPTVRRVVASVDLLPDIDPEPLDRLRPLVEQVAADRHAANYKNIVEVLPDLVDQLLVAGERDGVKAYELLFTLYRAGNTLAHKMGHYDLSMLATERMEWAAWKTEDPLLLATAKYVRSASLARVGETRRAMLLADKTIADIEQYRDGVVGGAVLSALHMRRADLAATFADPDTADTHFAEARVLGKQVGDRQVHGTVVGPLNADLFELSAAVNLGRIGKAQKLAEDIVLPADYPRERKAHYWLDRTRVDLASGMPDSAVSNLQNVFEAAPEYFSKSRAVGIAVDVTLESQKRVTRSLKALAIAAGRRPA